MDGAELRPVRKNASETPTMPLYDFHCQECNVTFEQALGMNAAKEGIECPQCSGQETQRLFSAFAIGRGKSAAPGAPSNGEGCALPGG